MSENLRESCRAALEDKIINLNDLVSVGGDDDKKTLQIFMDMEKEIDELKARLEKSFELHCAVGDIVYVPWVWKGDSGIFNCKVDFIRINELHNAILCLNIKHKDVNYELTYSMHCISAFNETWFNNYELAEKKLQELEGAV